MKFQNQHRAVALDGLRGFAAWVVVGYHYLLYFYSGFAPAFYNNSSQEAGFASILIQSPLNFFFNGPLAVSIFFVISGFVLSYGYFSKPDILHLQSGAFRRYFRLVIPIAAAQLFSFTLLISHLYFNQETSKYTHTPGFLGSVYLFTPSFWFMVKETFYYSLIGGFTYPWQESYNNVLWTLQIEFMGSLLVFCILALTGTHKLRGIVYVILTIILTNSNLIGFVLGLALADIMNSGGINTLKKYDALNYFLFILGILIGCYRGQTHGWYHYFFGIFLEIESTQRTFAQNTVSATLLVISLVHSNSLSKLFSSRWFNFMGRISYGTYLIHLPVLCSFSAYLFLILVKSGSMGIMGVHALVLGITVPLLVLISYLFTIGIDEPTVKYLKQLYTSISKDKSSVASKIPQSPV